MFAVIETGGKQYLIKKGSVIRVEKLEAEEGSEVEIGRVVYLSNNGLSYSSNATVKAEVLEQLVGEKVIVFKKKRRKNFRRKAGHRQCMTVLCISEINFQK